jgi:replicative DNA helicase
MINLERAVERALVGSLLLEPDQIDEVRGWLHLDDLAGTAERQAYAAIEALRDQGTAVTPQGVDAAVHATVPRGTQLADGPYLVTVMQETPYEDRSVVYGRMVLELSIRRRVAEEAAGLHQHAETASSAHDLNIVFGHVDQFRRGVEALHQREALAAGAHSVTPARESDLPPLVRFPRHEHVLEEQRAIVSLTEHPACLTQLSKWLRPNDFGDEECAALYGELLAMHHARSPIDRITVAWRAAKVNIDGPVCRTLTSGQTNETTVGEPVQAAHRVLEQSVRSAVIATSESLEAAAVDPRLNPTSVAYARLNALWPQQRRLVKARFVSA